MTEHVLSPIFGPPRSAVEIGTERGHWQFLSEQADALDAALQRGDTFTARRHLRAIQAVARKAQGI